MDEGNSAIPLTVQLQLTPPGATLQYDIFISLSVSSGSATGTVHELVEMTPTQVYCIFMIDTFCEVVLCIYSM